MDWHALLGLPLPMAQEKLRQAGVEAEIACGHARAPVGWRVPFLKKEEESHGIFFIPPAASWPHEPE